jgi:vacuolar-type H+-ATPase subunit E/Vma4
VNGLEAIKDRIMSAAREKASDYDYAADKQIREILDEAGQKAEQINKQSDAQAKTEVESILKRAHSMAISEKRKILLASKQKQVQEVLDAVLKTLADMPDEKKSDLYSKMLESLDDSGEVLCIQFCHKDIPIGKTVISKYSSMELHPLPGGFCGGFILYRNNIEINMTFEMIIRQYRSDLVSIAADSLFS